MADQGASANYWCHECQEIVVPVTTPSEVDDEEEIACMSCGSAFIEALESDDVDHPQYFHAEPSTSTPPTTNNTEQDPNDNVNTGLSNRIQQVISQMINPAGTTTGENINPMLNGLHEMTSQALREHLSESLNTTTGSPNIGVIFTDASGSMMNMMENTGTTTGTTANHPHNIGAALFQNLMGGGGDGAQFGDYAFGNIGSIINQLMQQDSNRHGAPPASKKVVKELPLVALTSLDLEGHNDECPVCKDTFEVGDQVKRLPCSHFFHPGCILPWLEQHNSCPTCRFELTTDDPEYEQQRNTATTSQSSSSNRPNQ